MKKLLVFALAVVMLFSCMSASALNLDELPEDYKLELDLPEIYIPELEQDSFGNAKDIVSRDGDVYTVNSGAIKYKLDLSKYPAMLCFTQDKRVSFEAYLQSKNANEMQKSMVDNNISFELLDLETALAIVIYSKDENLLTAMLEDFSTLDSTTQQAVASRIATGSKIRQTGKTAWIDVGKALVTIFNSRFVIVEYTNIKGKTSDDDLADTLDILSNLKLS